MIKINYAIDANIEKAERVFPDDYKINDEEKDSYDELFDDWRRNPCPEAISFGKKVTESDIYKPSEKLKNLFRNIGKGLRDDEVYDYGSKLNEKYSVIDKEDGKKIEDWEEFREIEDNEKESQDENLDDLMDFINGVFEDR